MKKISLLAVLLLIPIFTFTFADDNKSSDWQKRIEHLEKWKAQAEIRLKRLEDLLLSEGKTQKPELGQKDISRKIIRVTIENKRFQDTDINRNIYEQAIWWDATYEAIGITKPARAIKGVIEFADLFGEVHFQVRSTINIPISPSKKVTEKGIGFKYNQFLAKHKWMRSTKLKNMKVTYKVISIIYADGTTKKFE